MLWQQRFHTVDGFCGYAVSIQGKVEIHHCCSGGVEIVHSLHCGKQIVGSYDRTTVVRVGAVRIGRESYHAHVVRLGFAIVAYRISGGQAYSVSNADVQLFRHVFRQRDFVGILRLVPFRDIHGEHVLLCRGGNDLAADGAVSLGNADAGFHRGTDAANPFDAGDLVEMKVADSAGIRLVEFLIAQVGAVDAHRIVGVSEHGGQPPCQGVVHGIAEQEGAGDERRADHDGDACGYEHALGFSHEFQSDGPHGGFCSLLRMLL